MSTRKFKTVFLFVCTCATLAMHISAEAKGHAVPRYGAFVYSNLCVEANSGDTAGVRITLLRHTTGDTVIFEDSAGALLWPVVAEGVKFDASWTQLEFKLKADGAADRLIHAKQAANGQKLLVDGIDFCGPNPKPVMLSLVGSFAQPMKQCAPCPKSKK